MSSHECKRALCTATVFSVSGSEKSESGSVENHDPREQTGCGIAWQAENSSLMILRDRGGDMWWRQSRIIRQLKRFSARVCCSSSTKRSFSHSGVLTRPELRVSACLCASETRIEAILVYRTVSKNPRREVLQRCYNVVLSFTLALILLYSLAGSIRTVDVHKSTCSCSHWRVT